MANQGSHRTDHARLLLGGLFGLSVLGMAAVVVLAALGAPDAARYISAFWAPTCGVLALGFGGKGAVGELVKASRRRRGKARR